MMGFEGSSSWSLVILYGHAVSINKSWSTQTSSNFAMRSNINYLQSEVWGSINIFILEVEISASADCMGTIECAYRP
jgi:hypothetical protein